MAPRHTYIATRVDTLELIRSPDKILQHMSMKIHQRREEAVKELIGTMAAYKDGDQIRSCIVQSVNDSHAVVHVARSSEKVPLHRLCHSPASQKNTHVRAS